MEKAVLIAGTYDPITIGHKNIVRRAAKIFDKVYVAVFTNTSKDAMFTYQTRYDMVKESLQDIENVEVIYGEGLISDLAKKLGVIAIVKGARNARDFDYEMEMAKINKELTGIDTLVLTSDNEYQYISSTFVRELVICGKRIDKYVPFDTDKYFC